MLASSPCGLFASEDCSSHPRLARRNQHLCPLAPRVQNVVLAMAQPFSLFPVSLASFHNPWFQFDFVYKVGFFFFLAFCFLNKPKSKTNQVSSIAFPFF